MMLIKRTLYTLVILYFGIVLIGKAGASTEYGAKVIRVIDGDTVELLIPLWLNQTLTTKVRLNGIDTPEKRSRKGHITPTCEKILARKATLYLDVHLSGKSVTLTNVKYGKYAGRVLGDLYADGLSVSAKMLKSGHAIKYTGGRRDYVWCK